MGAVLSQQEAVTSEDFVQPRALWNVLGKTPGQQENFVSNVSGHLCDANEKVRNQTYGYFSNVDKDLGRRIKEATEAIVSSRKPRL